MPTYEYRCDACGHELTVEQRITEPKLTTCPKCAADKLVRLISGGNFILKGGGWYADLYHKPAGGTSSKGDNSGEPKSESKAATDGASSASSASPAPSASPPASGSSGSKP